ncbi:MAG: hypothetical protein CMJ78_01485 [Planctomycetaceae bacterium]|nr:hypothetical protein [Planctomycetaceae bacterium]
MINPRLITLLGVMILASSQVSAEKREPFELRDGDRVVLLGGTLVERAQKYGFVESALVSAYPDRNISFRNLGWSGDTVFAESRGIFDPPAVGYRRIIEQITELKPTLIFIAYGTNESFAGKAGLERFLGQLNKLIDDVAKTKADIVLLSPHRHEVMKPPLPDASKNNPNLKLYTDAIERLAQQRSCQFANLYETTVPAGSKATYTYNGIHFAEKGYQRLGGVLVDELRLPHQSADILVSADRKIEANGTAKVFVLDGAKSLGVSIQLKRLHAAGDWPRLKVNGLKAGNYEIKVDGKTSAKLSAKQLAESGFSLGDGPDGRQLTQLLSKTIDKNLLYFHRWRPQNVTYLFGFRKHEQGNNAKEVAEFEPLVRKEESVIAKLRVPKPHRYEIVSAGK